MIAPRVLGAQPLFESLPTAALESLSAAFTIEDQPEGTLLADVGTPHDALRIVLTGRLSITALGDTTSAKPGDCVGEEAVRLGPRRDRRIVVAEPARLACLTPDAFDRVFRTLLKEGTGTLGGPDLHLGTAQPAECRVPHGEARGVGLALSSGGALAIAHVGVLRSLLRAGVPVAAVAGSSGGALFGALFCRGLSLDCLIAFAGELSRLVRRRGGLWDFVQPPATGLIRGELTTRLYQDALAGARFADLSIPLQLVATDLVTGAAVHLNSGSVAEAVRVSMGVPGVYEPCRVGDSLLVDGGFSDPTAGCTTLLPGCSLRVASITLDDPEELGVLAPPVRGPHLLSLVTARANALLDHLPPRALSPEADVVIRPELSSFSVLDYGRAEELIAAGEAAAEERLPDLLRMLEVQGA